MSGIVYIFTNRHMPELALLGHIDVGTIDKEIIRLSSEGVPVDFDCFYAAEVQDPKKVDNKIRKKFSQVFELKGKGFFKQGMKQEIKNEIELFEILNITPNHLHQANESNLEDEKETGKETFDFYKLGIEKNTALHLKADKSVTCTVHDNKKVNFNGRTMHFSKATMLARRMINKPTKTESYRGASYWLYNDKPLVKYLNDYINQKNK